MSEALKSRILMEANLAKVKLFIIDLALSYHIIFNINFGFNTCIEFV